MAVPPLVGAIAFDEGNVVPLAALAQRRRQRFRFLEFLVLQRRLPVVPAPLLML